MTALVITSGVVSIVLIVAVATLIADDKIKFTGLRRTQMGVSMATFEAQQEVEQAKASAQKEAYVTFEDRMRKARMGDEGHNLPPIEQELLHLIFGKTPGAPIRVEIEEAPKAQGRQGGGGMY